MLCPLPWLLLQQSKLFPMRKTSTAARPMVCQVSGCPADIASMGHFNRRCRICSLHAASPSLKINGKLYRFCQQCNRLHDLSDFDGALRGCRVKLAKHNARRRKLPYTKKAKVVSPSQDQEATTGQKLGPSSMIEAKETANAANIPELPSKLASTGNWKDRLAAMGQQQRQQQQQHPSSVKGVKEPKVKAEVEDDETTIVANIGNWLDRLAAMGKQQRPSPMNDKELEVKAQVEGDRTKTPELPAAQSKPTDPSRWMDQLVAMGRQLRPSPPRDDEATGAAVKVEAPQHHSIGRPDADWPAEQATMGHGLTAWPLTSEDCTKTGGFPQTPSCPDKELPLASVLPSLSKVNVTRFQAGTWKVSGGSPVCSLGDPPFDTTFSPLSGAVQRSSSSPQLFRDLGSPLPHAKQQAHIGSPLQPKGTSRRTLFAPVDVKFTDRVHIGQKRDFFDCCIGDLPLVNGTCTEGTSAGASESSYERNNSMADIVETTGRSTSETAMFPSMTGTSITVRATEKSLPVPFDCSDFLLDTQAPLLVDMP